MKKKIWIPIVAVAVVLIMVLFLPIPGQSYDDGGTREWTALTYKIVDWNRATDDGVYEKTRVYTGQERFKSVDQLWLLESEYVEHSFLATVLRLTEDTAFVEPVIGEEELLSCDRFTFAIPDSNSEIGFGSVVRITYVGHIRETSPAQIDAVRWEISKDLRHLDYSGTWLDKETAEIWDGPDGEHLIISEIYADCFFARGVIFTPYTVKVNGTLSEKWCEGDQVLVMYSNIYTDKENWRKEADMVSIEASTFQIDPNAAYKPVIYLYPQRETEISVKLNLDGELTCTYPAYNDGWKVTAFPDGTLLGSDGQSYNYLYWEGETNAQWDMTRGFCVAGSDTAAFLEDALARLGLNRREANEFIVYWLPLMQENPYNIISFQTDVYTDAAKLEIVPQPDTLIRVFMAYKPSEYYVDVAPQGLSAPERVGFTAVEWGGTEVN